MRKTAKSAATALSFAAILGSATLIPLEISAAEGASDMIAMGKDVAFDRKKGNCLACHMIAGGSLPGNIGPPLVAMKARFPDYEKMKAQIADPRITNPNTIMIPFGPHGVLSKQEIELVSQFIYTL